MTIASPTDHSNNTFSDQDLNARLMQKVTKSQIRRCYIYAGMLTVPSSFLLATWFFGTLSEASRLKTLMIPNIIWIIGIFCTGIFIELTSAVALKRQVGGARFFNIFPYVLSILEVAIPTAILFILSSSLPLGVGLTAPPIFGYSVVIIFSGLHLNSRVCLFTGTIAGLAYLTLSLYTVLPSQPQIVSDFKYLVYPGQHGLKSIFLFIVGVIMMFVTHENKKNLISSFRDRHKKVLEMEKNSALANTFQKFVPKQLLDRIATEGIENIKIGVAENENAVVLFSDIRGFTPLAEQLQPKDLLYFLNSYFKMMNATINTHHGFIDQFVGDAIKALFVKPNTNTNNSAENAILSAVAMQQEIDTLYLPQTGDKRIPLQVGIGIHCGPVVVGTIGAKDRMDSTVLGEVVNTASRLESLTKYYGAKIIVSKTLLDTIDDRSKFHYRELDFVKVKGATKSLRIYEIYDCCDDKMKELKKRCGAAIKQGLDYRRDKNWNQAQLKFKEALTIYPDDIAAKCNLLQLEALMTKEHPQDWDGAIKLDKK